jgi:hypothetical protein
MPFSVGLGLRGVLDQAGYRLAGLGGQAEEGSQLHVVDTGVPDEGQQFDLVREQPCPLVAEVVEEEPSCGKCQCHWQVH